MDAPEDIVEKLIADSNHATANGVVEHPEGHVEEGELSQESLEEDSQYKMKWASILVCLMCILLLTCC